jgi:hypothetical protein
MALFANGVRLKRLRMSMVLSVAGQPSRRQAKMRDMLIPRQQEDKTCHIELICGPQQGSKSNTRASSEQPAMKLRTGWWTPKRCCHQPPATVDHILHLYFSPLGCWTVIGLVTLLHNCFFLIGVTDNKESALAMVLSGAPSVSYSLTK